MIDKIREKKILTEWDHYWDEDKVKTRFLYNVIAKFYRKYIIRGSLNYHIKHYIPKGSTLLHAGCGSGDVDWELKHSYKIIAMDLSPLALKLYKKINGPKSNVVLGNIFNLPSGKTYDAVYNLGVMEHYTEREILLILKQFKKVVKKNGHIILFWPPEYGISVMFFKLLVYLFKNILKIKNVKFHPTEITRLKSRKHAEKIIKKSGLKIVDVHFGIRDLFTYAVVVAQKIN